MYDELGRKTAEWKDAVGTGTKLAEWAFDTLLLGQPTSSTRWNSGNAYVTAVSGYDTGNRPTGTTVTIPAVETGLGGSYAFGITCTANGSIATRTLPAAGGLTTETLTTTYNTMGLPRKLSGTNNYVTETAYLQTGPTVTALTHGTTAYRAFNYDPATLRLSHVNVQAASTPDILAEIDYKYDDAGNVIAIKNLLAQYGGSYGPDDIQCFEYDYLRRLSQAWTPAANDCSTDPTTAALGGAAPYWLSWLYDTTGNRTSQTNHTTGGDLTTTYNYPAAGTPRPHGLTGTAGATTGSYSYDNAGNTISRPGPTAQQTLTWDFEGHLATVAEGASASGYLYDADGNRIITRDPTGTTLHLPEGMEIHVDPAGAPTGRKLRPTRTRTGRVSTSMVGCVCQRSSPFGTARSYLNTSK